MLNVWLNIKEKYILATISGVPEVLKACRDPGARSSHVLQAQGFRKGFTISRTFDSKTARCLHLRKQFSHFKKSKPERISQDDVFLFIVDLTFSSLFFRELNLSQYLITLKSFVPITATPAGNGVARRFFISQGCFLPPPYNAISGGEILSCSRAFTVRNTLRASISMLFFSNTHFHTTFFTVKL